MTALLIAASLVSPLFVDFAPEVRTSYQSLGKIVEDVSFRNAKAYFTR